MASIMVGLLEILVMTTSAAQAWLARILGCLALAFHTSLGPPNSRGRKIRCIYQLGNSDRALLRNLPSGSLIEESSLDHIGVPHSEEETRVLLRVAVGSGKAMSWQDWLDTWDSRIANILLR